MAGREPALFVLLCLIWGTTWIAIKAGVDSAPPLLFAGTRFTVAGAVLAGVHAWKAGGALPARRDLARLLASSLLMITACYALLFWGVQFISSGLAGVLEMTLTPISLLFFALLLGDERFDIVRAGSIALGAVGIVILMLPSATEASNPNALVGCASVSAAAVAYGLGAVMSRTFQQRYSSLYLSAFMMVTGGGLLTAIALIFEPNARGLLAAWPRQAVAGWLYLVIFGSLIGYPIYMHLLRVWGSSRSGSYAFVSSVVAVFAGMAVYGEELSVLSMAAMAVLLFAAWLAMRPTPEREQGKTRAR